MSKRRQAATALLTAALCAGMTGCALIDWARRLSRGPGNSEPEAMSVLEARSALAQARQCLYGRRTPDVTSAISLADAVAAGCSEPQCTWEACAVKAAAHQAAGDHKQAALAARRGVDAVLSMPPGRPDDTALTALKRLSVVYVENAVAARGEENPAERLKAWEQKLRGRYGAETAADREALLAAEAMFRVLQELTEEVVADRVPERRARRLVKQYIRRFNRRDTRALLKLIRPGAPLAARIAGRAGPLPAGLDLLGAIRVSMSDETATATATCDLLATSAAGWARTTKGVRFELVKERDGAWLIQDITGHP